MQHSLVLESLDKHTGTLHINHWEITYISRRVSLCIFLTGQCTHFVCLRHCLMEIWQMWVFLIGTKVRSWSNELLEWLDVYVSGWNRMRRFPSINWSETTKCPMLKLGMQVQFGVRDDAHVYLIHFLSVRWDIKSHLINCWLCTLQADWQQWEASSTACQALCVTSVCTHEALLSHIVTASHLAGL